MSNEGSKEGSSRSSASALLRSLTYFPWHVFFVHEHLLCLNQISYICQLLFPYASLSSLSFYGTLWSLYKFSWLSVTTSLLLFLYLTMRCWKNTMHRIVNRRLKCLRILCYCRFVHSIWMLLHYRTMSCLCL